MLSDLKISTRLTLGFGLMGLLIALMGSVSLLLANGADRSFHLIIDDRMPKVLSLHVVKEDVLAVELGLDRLLDSRDAQATRRHESRIAERREEIAKLLHTLDAQVQSTRGRALLSRTAEARTTYDREMGRFFDLLHAGDHAAAARWLREAMEAPRLAYFAALDELIAYQETLSRAAQEDAASAIVRMNTVVVALTAAALAGAVLIGVGILRSTTRPLRRAVQLAKAVAQGDLRTPIEVHGRSETAQLLAALRDMQGALATLVGQVQGSAQNVAQASSQIAQGNRELSERTEEQASALQQTAAAMEQLNVTVRHNAENARQAASLARDASSVASGGGQAVADMVATMQDIHDQSGRIADIVGVIDGIAFQTNLLALNAAVEAARAGEQGRGFAVVAGEVRTLAQRSSAAAREIRQLIAASVARVGQGSQLADQAGRTMRDVLRSIERVNQIVDEISAASTEQSQGLDQVNDAVSAMDRNTQQNAALVEEMAAAAASLNQQAHELLHTAGVFQTEATAPGWMIGHASPHGRTTHPALPMPG
ncbi:methyl-accepting chemotaxis protein [Acidovorax lacteus]|uniref:Methyl-accepting chemotaxis protein n=1 Tax=Acidovorax lacteus TaxID=1924988 RepID=A0ABP8KYF2_9BURK